MLPLGTRILQAWCFLNALPGVACLVAIALGRHAPGLRMHFGEEEIALIESRALRTIDGIAVIGNSLIVVVCLLMAVIAQKGLLRRQTWALPTLAGSAVLIQLAAIGSDSFFGFQNLIAIAISSALLIVELTISARGSRA